MSSMVENANFSFEEEPSDVIASDDKDKDKETCQKAVEEGEDRLLVGDLAACLKAPKSSQVDLTDEKRVRLILRRNEFLNKLKSAFIFYTKEYFNENETVTETEEIAKKKKSPFWIDTTKVANMVVLLERKLMIQYGKNEIDYYEQAQSILTKISLAPTCLKDKLDDLISKYESEKLKKKKELFAHIQEKSTIKDSDDKNCGGFCLCLGYKVIIRRHILKTRCIDKLKLTSSIVDSSKNDTAQTKCLICGCIFNNCSENGHNVRECVLNFVTIARLKFGTTFSMRIMKPDVEQKIVNESENDEESEDKLVKKDLESSNRSGTPSTGQLVNNNASDLLGSFQASDLKIETPPNEFILHDIPSNQESEKSLVPSEKAMDDLKKSPSTILFEQDLDDFGSKPLSDLGSENYRVSTLYGSKSSQSSSAIKLGTNEGTTQSDQNLPEPEIFEIVENWLQNSGEEMEAVPLIEDENDQGHDEMTGEKVGQNDDFDFEKFKASKARLEQSFSSLDQIDEIDDDLKKNDNVGQVDSISDLPVGSSLFAPGHGSNDSVVSGCKKSITLSKAKSKSLNPKEMWSIDLDSLKDELEDTKKAKGFSWSKFIPCLKAPEDAGSPQMGQSVLDAAGQEFSESTCYTFEPIFCSSPLPVRHEESKCKTASKTCESAEFIPNPMDTSTPQVYANLLESHKIDEESFQRDAFERAKSACGATFDGFEIPKKVIVPENEHNLDIIRDNFNEAKNEKVEDYDSEGFEVEENSPFSQKDDTEVKIDDEKVDDLVETELEIAPIISDVNLEEVDETLPIKEPGSGSDDSTTLYYDSQKGCDLFANRSSMSEMLENIEFSHFSFADFPGPKDIKKVFRFMTTIDEKSDPKVAEAEENRCEVKDQNETTSVASVTTMKSSSGQNQGENFNEEVYFSEKSSPEMRIGLQPGRNDVVGFLDKNRDRLDLEKLQKVANFSEDSQNMKMAAEKIDPNESETNLIKYSESTEFIPNLMDTPQFHLDIIQDNFNDVKNEKVEDYDSEGFEVEENSPFSQKDDTVAKVDDEKVDDFVETELEIAPIISDVKLEEVDEENLPKTPRFVHERILVSSPRVVLEPVEEPAEETEELAKSKEVFDFPSAKIEVVNPEENVKFDQKADENGNLQEEMDGNEQSGGESDGNFTRYGEKEAEDQESEELDDNQNEQEGSSGVGNGDSNDQNDKNEGDFAFENDENDNQNDGFFFASERGFEESMILWLENYKI